MDKIYIVTAGDSFTDSHVQFVDTDNSQTVFDVVKMFNEKIGLCAPNYMMKYQLFLLKELIDKGIEFEYYNVGKGSSGNHVITHRYRKQINELLDRGIDPKKIYGTLQLSGLVRPTNPVYEIEFDLPNVEGGEWDYLNNVDEHTFEYKNILEAHLTNMENIIKFNVDNGITNFKMFFGWNILFEDELIRYEVKERFKNIDTNYFFIFPYTEKEDFVSHNCSGNKRLLQKLFGIKPKYFAPAGEYGGMNEFVREHCNEGEYWYGAYNDPHLNTFGNWIWYTKFYRQLFQNWGLIDEVNTIKTNTKTYNILQTIFQINFQTFIDSYDFDFSNNEICIEKQSEYYKKYFMKYN